MRIITEDAERSMQMSIFKRNSRTEEGGKQAQSDLPRERFNFNAALKGFREISMDDLERVSGGVRYVKKNTPPKNPK